MFSKKVKIEEKDKADESRSSMTGLSGKLFIGREKVSYWVKWFLLNTDDIQTIRTTYRLTRKDINNANIRQYYVVGEQLSSARSGCIAFKARRG